MICLWQIKHCDNSDLILQFQRYGDILTTEAWFFFLIFWNKIQIIFLASLKNTFVTQK